MLCHPPYRLPDCRPEFPADPVQKNTGANLTVPPESSALWAGSGSPGTSATLPLGLCFHTLLFSARRLRGRMRLRNETGKEVLLLQPYHQRHLYVCKFCSRTQRELLVRCWESLQSLTLPSPSLLTGRRAPVTATSHFHLHPSQRCPQRKIPSLLNAPRM